MKNYSQYINPYMRMILENKVEHNQEQEDMINNIVIPVLERDDVVIKDDKIKKGLSLQKYFPYKLIEWEIFLFALIVGVEFANGNIFFTDIRIIVGRGSGKNGFISFLIFYFLSPYHGIMHYDVDLLANSEKQVKTSFVDVYDIITDPPNPEHKKALNANYYATKEEIIGRKTKSKLVFNTSSKRGKDSKRTGCAIYDEVHEYEDATNMNTLKSGLGKVWHGRQIIITTDGHIRGGVLDKQKEQNIDILKAYNPLNRTLVFWCRIEEEEEGKDPDKWVKAIPSINDFPSLKDTIAKEVQDMPYNMDYYPEYMAKRMNFPIGNKDVEVASWDDILATNQEIPELKGRDCVGGIDYAKTNDFVGCVLIFRQGEKVIVLQHTFICKRSRDLPGIKPPLWEWERARDVEFVDDVEIPADIIAEWFYRMGAKYNIKKIAIDNFRYSLLNSALKKIGFDAFEKKNVKLVRPNDILKVSPVINSLFVRHNFIWGDCPVLRWATHNTKKEQNNGNISYGKIEPNYRKTDTFMALVSAMTIVEEVKEKEKPKVRRVPVITIGGD